MRAPEDPAVDILLVEDNPGDAELTRIAFREAQFAHPLQVVQDGVEALAFLRREPPFSHAPRPGLILLDLNLPRMDGCQVLHAIKSDPDLRRIPVCVLTTSREEMDVVRSYDLHANSYITKPATIESFFDAVRRLERYWMGVVSLPST